MFFWTSLMVCCLRPWAEFIGVLHANLLWDFLRGFEFPNAIVEHVLRDMSICNMKVSSMNEIMLFLFWKKNSRLIGNQIMQNMPMELSGDQILEHEEITHALLDIGQSIN